MRYRLLVALICGGLFVAFGSPSLADRTSLNDEKDAFGPLDVKRISHGHGFRRGYLAHRLWTYRKWGRSTLRSEDSDIQLLFTTDRDNRPERVLVLDASDTGVSARMHQWRRGGVGAKVYGRGIVRRMGPRAVRLTFRRRLLGRGVREYGWHVDTRYSDRSHHRCRTSDELIVVCPDSAPNNNQPRAYLRHR
jgi:hypothetical protein